MILKSRLAIVQAIKNIKSGYAGCAYKQLVDLISGVVPKIVLTRTTDGGNADLRWPFLKQREADIDRNWGG